MNEISQFSNDTAMVFIETPSNPLLRITYIKHISEKAQAKDALVVIDNTFLTPYFQRPLEHSTDIVVYSATKYIGDHGDLIFDIVTTNDDELVQRLYFLKNTLSATLSPYDAYALIRRLKTLSVRFDKQVEDTQKIIEFLHSRKAVQNSTSLAHTAKLSAK